MMGYTNPQFTLLTRSYLFDGSIFIQFHSERAADKSYTGCDTVVQGHSRLSKLVPIENRAILIAFVFTLYRLVSL